MAETLNQQDQSDAESEYRGPSTWLQKQFTRTVSYKIQHIKVISLMQDNEEAYKLTVQLLEEIAKVKSQEGRFYTTPDMTVQILQVVAHVLTKVGGRKIRHDLRDLADGVLQRPS